MRSIFRLLATLLAGALLVGAAPLVGARAADELGIGAPVEAASPPPVELERLARRTVVVAENGTTIAALYEKDRDPVPLDEVPKVLVNAVIATEDAGFFEHEGFSVQAVLRALRENAEAGSIEEGGSTITQQVIKNAVLDDEQTLERKLREALLAVRLEDQLGKEAILERYLNTVYFGQGAYGVKAAVERFFGKRLEEVTVPEAALLAGAISSPATYNPFNNPEAARERRAIVLDRMAAEGYITESEAERFKDAPLPKKPHDVLPDQNTYFVAEVKRQLMNDPRLGETRAERYEKLFKGGLRIVTTFDPRLQQLAANAVHETLPPSEFTMALASLDAGNGKVRAVVGGPGFDEQKFNIATQGGRQPGSLFKAVTLLAWIEAGNSPEDIVDGTSPCSFVLPNGEVWNVENYAGARGGLMTVREATQRSINCAYARIAVALGPEKIVDMAHRLGVTRELEAYHPITLGVEEVSPIEMATVAATLANDGVRHYPMWVNRIEDANGNVILRNEPKGERVISSEVARIANSVLQGVNQPGGTARRASIGRPLAGKTGTAQNWTDAWFMGYTPQMATVVWMGHPFAKVPMKGVAGRNVTGGSFPAMAWARYMGPALEGQPVLGFPPPPPLPPPGVVGLNAPRVAPPPPPPA